MNLLDEVKSEVIVKKEWPDFKSGDTITVHYKIKEGDKFKGAVGSTLIVDELEVLGE